jgi:hypothetical protein
MPHLYVNNIFKEIDFSIIARQWFELIQLGMVELLNQASKNNNEFVSSSLKDI